MHLRWMCGASVDRISNDRIGNIKEITVIEREEEYERKRLFNTEVEGIREKGRPGRWRD